MKVELVVEATCDFESVAVDGNMKNGVSFNTVT